MQMIECLPVSADTHGTDTGCRNETSSMLVPAERLSSETAAVITLVVWRGASHGRSPKAEALDDHGSARNGFTQRQPLRPR